MYRTLLFTLLFTSSLGAQNCIDMEVLEVLYDTDSYGSYSVLVDITRTDGSNSDGYFIASGIATLNATQGNYGRTTLGPISCDEDFYGISFADRANPAGCISPQYNLARPNFCGTGSCQNVAIVDVSLDSTCPTTGPIFRIVGGAAPLVVTVSGPGGITQDTLADFLERTLDLSDRITLGEYRLAVLTGDECQATYDYALSCPNSINGISWHDENENGLRDPGEPGLYTDVELQQIVGGSYTAYTSSRQDGSYQFNFVPPGEYELSFTSNECSATPTTPNVGNNEAVDSDARSDATINVVVSSSNVVANLTDIGWIVTECEVTVDVQNAFCDSTSGSITIQSACQDGVYTLYDNAGNEIGQNNTGNFPNISPGSYSFIVVLPGGCVYEGFYTVQGAGGAPTLEREGSLCSADGAVTLFGPPAATYGVDAVDYLWSTGETTQNIVVAELGTYTLSVSLPDGCEVTSTITVEADIGNFLFAENYRTNCSTGEAFIPLPDGYEEGQEILVNGLNTTQPTFVPGGMIITENASFLDVTVQSENCILSQGTSVSDGYLQNLNLFVLGSDCSNVDGFELQDEGDIIFSLVQGDDPALQVVWSGPGIIDSSQAGLIFIDGTPGLYQAEVSSYCGTRTLSYVVAQDPADCDTTVTGPIVFTGRLTQALGNNCGAGTSDLGIPNVLIEVTSENGDNVFYSSTDTAGNYTATVPGGTSYTVRIADAGRRALIPCQDGATLEAVTTGQHLELTATYATPGCADLDIDISSNRFRRCFANTAAIRYGNYGGVVSEETVLEVTVDSLFEEISASVPFTRLGDVLMFDVGDLPPFTVGSILLSFTVSCESEFGQLHCLDGTISSNNNCDVRDDAALVRVDAVGCTGDSLRFTIFNEGARPMDEDLEYYVYIDGLVDSTLSVRRPPLQPGEELVLALPATGATVTVVAKQISVSDMPVLPPADIPPRFPSATITGCGSEIPGLAIIGGDAGVSGESELCRTNTGSFDPNEKLVFPMGLGGDENHVEPGTRLTYELHFQNTGTDTAFTVVIRDTLPEELDVSSIEFGAASHPYEIAIENGRQLTFTFNNIDLVDSFTNVMGSMGVVNFTINPRMDLPRGTRFENRAGIYFDFNEPIITEYARTQIAPLPPTLVANRPFPTVVLPITVYPNPVSDQLWVDLPANFGAARSALQITNALGQIVHCEFAHGDRIHLDVSAYAAGAYVISAFGDGRLRARGRFVVR